MVEVIPTILTSDPVELARLLELASVAKRVQIDIIDGEFVDNKTVDPSALNEVEISALLDFHLMVKEPIHWVEKCVNANADRVIGQIEQMGDQEKFVDFVHERGVSAGLALNIDTKVRELDWRVLDRVEVVLVLSVPAGFGGQEFERSALETIAELAKLREERKLAFAICDDGGVTLDNVDDASFAGVDEVVVGRRIFAGDVAENIAQFQKYAQILNGR